MQSRRRSTRPAVSQCSLRRTWRHQSPWENRLARPWQSLGGLQIIVNFAGIVQIDLLHECSLEEYTRTMDVNVRSIYHSIMHGLDPLRRNRRSYMVNIGSVGSLITQAMTPVYIALKYAVLGLTRSIAVDYANTGLRCNCVCPGITDMPMLRTHMNAMSDPEGAMARGWAVFR